MDEHQKWYLWKHDDGCVFGPMGFDHLRQWAVDAYVSPLDKVSTDQVNWVRAPMIPELQMDYLLEVEEGVFYGPTTVGAVRDFLARGEITEETPVTNCKTGEVRRLKEFAIFLPPQREESSPGIRVNLQARLKELEEALMEERRLRHLAEEMRARAEARVRELENLLSK